MFGNLFRKETPSEKFLYKEFGRKNKKLNAIIQVVPHISKKIYVICREMVNGEVRHLIENFGKKFGNPSIFKKINYQNARRIEVEIIALFLYFLEEKFYDYLIEEHIVKAFIHGIYLELARYHFLPDAHFYKYIDLKERKTSYKDIENRFLISLSILIVGKHYAALSSELETLPNYIKKYVDITFKENFPH